MIIYRVFDDEWEQIMGGKQLCDFAVSQVCNCADDYLEENLQNIFTNAKEISDLALSIQNNSHKINVSQAKTLLHVRCYDVAEIEVEEVEA